MSTQRKDMWRLLYNMVTKRDTDLKETFDLVDDILCKEPSLIHSYSLKPGNNRLQDTFLLWLMHKFFGYFNAFLSNDIHAANVKLQKRILSSCLCNRSTLFRKVVVCYSTVLATLVAEQPSGLADETVAVPSFNCDDNCLKEIDSGAEFHAIRVRVGSIDIYIQSCLDILNHALTVGYHVYPELFVESFQCVLQALKVGEMEAKLGSLVYCCKLFRFAVELTDQMQTCYHLVVKAIAVFWHQVRLWISMDCVETEDVESTGSISADLLDELSRYAGAIMHGQSLLENALHTFIDATQMSCVPPRIVGKVVSVSRLQRSLIAFICRLQSGDHSAAHLSDVQAACLFRLANEYPGALRAVAVAMAGSKQAFPQTSLLIRESLASVLGQNVNSIKEFQFLKEILYVLRYLELRKAREIQLLMLRENKVVGDFVSKFDFEEMCHLLQGDTADEKEQLLNIQIYKFLKSASEAVGSEWQIAYIEVAGVLLQIRLFKQLLKCEYLLQLISYVANPLDSGLSSAYNPQTDRESCYVSMQTLSGISFPKSSKPGKHLLQKIEVIFSRLFNPSCLAEAYSELHTAFFDNVEAFIVSGLISHRQLTTIQCFQNGRHPSELPSVLRAVCCTVEYDTWCAFVVSNYSWREKDTQHRGAFRFEIFCSKCSTSQLDLLGYSSSFLQAYEAFVIRWPSGSETREDQLSWKKVGSELLLLIKQLVPPSLLSDDRYNFVLMHFDLTTLPDVSLTAVTRSDIDTFSMKMFQLYLQQASADMEAVLPVISRFLLSQANKALASNNTSFQQQVLELISYCAEMKNIGDQWLYHLFKMTFFFVVHSDSLVVDEATLVATEMCYRRNTKPIQLWHWYRRDAWTLVTRLALHNYLLEGVRLSDTLDTFTKMLGFSCVQEFICKYYRLLTTTVLPFCVKEPECKGLLVDISNVSKRPVSELFVASFLRIYTHIYLTEETCIANKCIDFILKCTSLSLRELMSSDVKQTVSEFLIFFNRAPKFVMKAFQCLILNDKSNCGDLIAPDDQEGYSSSTEFAKFIADRFLGVITYFQMCLGDPYFEKPLKEEALYSLGQIMRFVGAKNVTQFRFKIIAILTFVLTLDDEHLQRICLKIWMVFLKIVDIEELGPSLSRIVACLQPLLTDKPAEVNAIYDYLILKNDSLLGAYIPNLYFVEGLPDVAPQIRRFIGRKMESLRSHRSNASDRLQFLLTQIANENVEVRVYGLDYMTNFIADNRVAINLMILEEIQIDPLVQEIVDILVAGSRHGDRNLQLASAKCLGELGAIDPSYLTSNYSDLKTKEMSLSIHTDEFAIMALKELCRAYQFQKDSKYVDNFSLAIQETLLMCGVSPKDHEKINVWRALPERMRQIMEPMLTSCYTGPCFESKCKEHPIFNSAFCRCYEEWAFLWASRLINFVKRSDTQHLLRSFKPSIKRDSNILALLFPYIVVHALEDSTELQKQQMTEEFEAVFKFSSSGLAKPPEYETSSVKEFLSTKYSVDPNTEITTVKNSDSKVYAVGDLTLACVKLCSEQVDFLHCWLREWQRSSIAEGKMGEPSDHYRHVEAFLSRLDMLLIAKANFHSGEFRRALMYLESYIEQDAKNRLQEQLSFLLQIHGSLLDADSVEGVVYLKKSNLCLTEEILVNSIVDRPQETISCYEKLMSKGKQFDQDHIGGMINCYLRMEIPETALLIADGLWQKFGDQYTDDYFKECKSELLWRLCRYEELQEILEDPVVRRKTTNWNIQCSEAFLLFRQPHSEHCFALEKFSSQIDDIRSNILSSMRTFSGVVYNSYSNSYDEVVKLHLLREMEKCKVWLSRVEHALKNTSATDDACLGEVMDFFADWDSRLCILRPTVRDVEPVLCFRRNLLIESKQILLSNCKHVDSRDILERISEMIDCEIGKLWIRSAQMSREAGGLQQAHLSIMKAEEYKPKMLFLEKAKLLWDKGDQTDAFKLIEESLEGFEIKCQGNIRLLEPADRSLYAEAKLLQATYNAESMNICSELNLRYFKEAIAGNKQSEKCFIQFAHYAEKIYESFSTEHKDGADGHKLLLQIMLNYARSLKYGFEHVYQSMPRLLSLWLDFTSRCATIGDEGASDSTAAAKFASSQDLAKKMNDLILNCSKQLPTSLFYTAFSQLLSRICHPSNDVFNVLRTIVIKLVQQYPHQSLWMLLPIFKSFSTNRLKRCRLVLADSRLAAPEVQKLLTDFNMLAERLIELTNKDVSLQRSYELSSLVKQLPKLFSDPNFSEILLPFEKYMQISLPILSASTSQKINLPMGTQPSFSTGSVPTNPFPYKQIYITGIKEEVVVLRSAAKPKKIIIQCNDGQSYEVMVKPKDDLRKDFRLMEFNGLVKRHLRQDSQARHRRLRIRTYAAIPFNEECGLVEWLPKLDSFRNICTSIYRARGLGIEDRLLRQCVLPKTDPIEKKRNIFIDTLLARHPPVFHEWFRQRFPTPHSWYEARSSYVKSIAVMSMVGYVLGLGDRHGENVLFDEGSGEAVHVDFNCLFNQGENFAYPELVPFRLTQNMVFAMGPLGVEGLYRKCCEITLRVLKKETKTLMSVLRPFVYDLVALNRSWNNKKTTSAEITDPKAMHDVARIEDRLKGYVNRTLGNSIPLSTEGQVNYLILEATNIDNLAAMYIGWGSYL